MSGWESTGAAGRRDHSRVRTPPGASHRARRRTAWMAGSVVLLAVTAGLPGPTPAQSQTIPVSGAVSFGGDARGLRVVGHTDLGGQGLNGEVAVVGSTAVVASGYVPMNIMEQATNRTAALNVAPPCFTVPVHVVDISDATNPRVVSTLPVPDGQAARDVDAIHVSTPAFTGDLAAIAFASCRFDFKTYFSRALSNPGSFADRGVAYYDITDPIHPRFLSRYFADFDNRDPDAGPCGPNAEANCAKDQFSVQLKRVRDGRILSLSTTPQGVANNTLSGDLRLVDVTDPTKPVQIGTWPALGEAPVLTLNNGCYARAGTRSARFSPDGTQILVPYLDGGLYVLDVLNLARPTIVGNWAYPNDWNVEGNGAYVASADVGGRQLTLLSDEDWWWQSSTMRIDSPPDIAGSGAGCMDLAVAMDQKYQAQISRQPGGQVSGELAYVGRGCEDRVDATGAKVNADPYLANPQGKIAFADPGAPAPLLAGLPTTFCSGGSKIRRAQDSGAKALVVARTAAVPDSAAGFPALGSPREPTDEVGALTGEFTIPSFNPKKGPSDAIRSVMCPTVVNGNCAGGRPVTVTLTDQPGAWGGLRVIDTTNPGATNQVAEYHTADAQILPPPDVRGIYSIHHAVTEGERAYAAWNSDGLRVLDLRSGGVPIEIGSFVPPDTPDPTRTVPAKTYVVGVALAGGHIVISDMNSGLWILDKPAPAGGRGHWLAGADGGVYAFGDAQFYGSMGKAKLNRPIVAMAPTPTGKGYWLAASDGGVFAFGDATYWGSMGRARLNSPVVGLSPTPSGRGYWLVAADGGVFAFGDARYFGSTSSTHLARPVVGITSTPTGAGYRLAAADGGVFAFGDARFLGAVTRPTLKAPVVGVTGTASGRGYWLAAADGSVFAFGDAPFTGSAAAARPAVPVIAMAAGAGSGYWLAGADGGIFALGAPFLGSLAPNRLAAPITSLAALPR